MCVYVCIYICVCTNIHIFFGKMLPHRLQCAVCKHVYMCVSKYMNILGRRCNFDCSASTDRCAMCVCVFIFVCELCVCVPIYMSTNIQEMNVYPSIASYAKLSLSVVVCVCVCVWIHTNIHIHIYIYIHIYIHTYTYVYIYIIIYIYMYTYSCVQINLLMYTKIQIHS